MALLTSATWENACEKLIREVAPRRLAVADQRIPVNGQLGPKTVQAVKKAQQDREREPTGRLDGRTVAALGISNAENASTGASDPVEKR